MFDDSVAIGNLTRFQLCDGLGHKLQYLHKDLRKSWAIITEFKFYERQTARNCLVVDKLSGINSMRQKGDKQFVCKEHDECEKSCAQGIGNLFTRPTIQQLLTTLQAVASHTRAHTGKKTF